MSKPLFSELSTIESARLILRKPRLEDAPKLFASYTNDSEVTHFLTWKTNQTISETEAFLNFAMTKWPENSEYHFVIEKKETGQPIGMFAVINKDPVEFGYVLAKNEWGQGYMTEAVQAMLEYLFTQTDISKVTIFCDAENKGSERVMQKAGLKFVKFLPKFSLHPNISEEKRDCVLYGISKEDFAQVYTSL